MLQKDDVQHLLLMHSNLLVAAALEIFMMENIISLEQDGIRPGQLHREKIS